jgi:hypothetical protein
MHCAWCPFPIAPLDSPYVSRLIILAARGLLAFTVSPPSKSTEPYPVILKVAKVVGAPNEKTGEFYETGTVSRRPWECENGDGS